MKHWIIILAPVVLLMPRSPAPKTPVPQARTAVGSNSSADYKLVWADEFNTNGAPDARNWTFEQGFVRNREQQWYQPENASCENGLLVIEARRQPVQNSDLDSAGAVRNGGRSHAEYTSASLMTKGLHQWTYGRFEMRGRIDTRPGLWPAFLDFGIGTPLAWVWRNRHHGVLSGETSGECMLAWYRLECSVGRFQETD